MRIVRDLWEAETRARPLRPLWLYKALGTLPNYHLLPQNVREELLCQVLALLSWHASAAEHLGAEGNARELPLYFNREAEVRAIEAARAAAQAAGVDLAPEQLRTVGLRAAQEPHLKLVDAFVDDMVQHLEYIARRYERRQPVRALFDQDQSERDALFEIVVPARGSSKALNDARSEVLRLLADIDRGGTGPEAWFIYSRSQRTEGTQEPNELVELLRHELRDYATESAANEQLSAWLSDRRGSNRSLARLLLARKGWPEGRLKTVEKELCRIRFAWQARDPRTGEISWPYDLEHAYGPMRGDVDPWDRPSG